MRIVLCSFNSCVFLARFPLSLVALISSAVRDRLTERPIVRPLSSFSHSCCSQLLATPEPFRVFCDMSHTAAHGATVASPGGLTKIERQELSYLMTLLLMPSSTTGRREHIEEAANAIKTRCSRDLSTRQMFDLITARVRKLMSKTCPAPDVAKLGMLSSRNRLNFDWQLTGCFHRPSAQPARWQPSQCPVSCLLGFGR